MLYGVDISEFQGQIDWDQLNAVANFVIIRASFGTERTDNKFAHNQSEARRVQAAAGPLGIGYYYFAYPTLLGAYVSAKYFIDNLGPLQLGEFLALDLEGAIGNDPVGWSLSFLQACENLTGVKPLLYINQSILNGYDWTPVINNGNGLWIAQYDGNKTTPGVSGKWPFAAFKQWTDADIVAGIAGKVDGDNFNGDFAALAAYGKQSTPTTTLPPVSSTTTTTTETTTSTTTTTVPPTPDPAPNPLPVPTPVPSPVPPPTPSLFSRIIAWFRKFFNL